MDRDTKFSPSGICGGMYKQCGGDGVAPTAACCNDGCVCHWKDKFYAQCRPPKGAFKCDAQAKAKEESASRKTLKELVTKKKVTAEKKEKTAKRVALVLEKVKVLRKDASDAGARRVHAQKVAARKASELKAAKKKAAKKKKGAIHAKHAIKYVTAEVGIWKKVAAGDSCSKLNAQHVLAMDPADISAHIEKAGAHTSSSSEGSVGDDDDSLGDLDLDDDDGDLDDLDLDADEDEVAAAAADDDTEEDDASEEEAIEGDTEEVRVLEDDK